MGTIGEKIRSLRKAHGWTLSYLGEQMGISGSLVGQYERGILNPKPETIARFASALGVSELELSDGELSERLSKAIQEAQKEIKFREECDEVLGDELTQEDHIDRWENTISDLSKKYNLDPMLLSCYVPRHGEITDPDIQKVSDIMQTMNDTGRRVVVERVQELAQIPAYQKGPDPDEK